MRPQRYLLPLISLLVAQTSFARYEVHEWGTFTSLIGSNGLTQHGMYHEDEALPDFVHGFGAIQSFGSLPTPPPQNCVSFKICPDFLRNNIVSQKMETPVIYFYSDQEREVRVNVRFPQGIVTETFPAPIRTSPTPETMVKMENGETTFAVHVTTKTDGNTGIQLPNNLMNGISYVPPIPYADPNNIYSHARNVNSNIIYSGREQEKFIFYRGLGRFQPRLQITSLGEQIQIMTPPGAEPLGAFLIYSDGSEHRAVNLGKLNPAQVSVISEHVIRALKGQKSDYPVLTQEGGQIRRALHESLMHAGLYVDEANAMLNTWENGYLRTPGLRLLYILPRQEVDQILPLFITPAPESLARVFIGRIEILLQHDEVQVLRQIRILKDQFSVQSLGRMAEPILRRVYEVYLAQTQESNQKPNPDMVRVFEGLIEKAVTQNEQSLSSNSGIN